MTLTRLEAWLGGVLGEVVSIESSTAPTTAGFSSETAIVTVRRGAGLVDYVLRRPPASDAFPLFPVYDFERQVAAMRRVAELPSVPVPTIVGVEMDPAVLGTPFFVMERAIGEPAPDNPPYVLDGWLLESPVATQQAVSDACIDVLVGIHSIGEPVELAPFVLDAGAGSPLRAHVDHHRAHYDWAREESPAVPLIEAGFEWLEANWPVESLPALSWGDARPANILWDSGRPTAVLYWESVAVAPAEVDLGWMLFFQQYFQDLAERFGRPGLPDFLVRERAVERYEQRAGDELAPLDWFFTYAAVRQAIVCMRVAGRRHHRGEAPLPDDPDDMVFHRRLLERALRDPAAAWHPTKG